MLLYLSTITPPPNAMKAASNGKRILQQRIAGASLPVLLTEGVYVVKIENSSGGHWMSKMVVAK